MASKKRLLGMKTLILAAGRFGDAMRTQIDLGREPRLDVFEIQRRLSADVIDYLDVDRSRLPSVRLAARTLGASAAVATLGYLGRTGYDAVLTTGEDIGLPLAVLLQASSGRLSHTMIAHTLYPAKKRVFFDYLRAERRIDCVFAYSTSEERNMIERLGIPARKVQRIYYHADERFFRPDTRATEPGLVCAAGQLLRDYDCLVDAVRGLPVRVQIAAGSPWIDGTLRPSDALPPNVSWSKLSRWELRELYARSAVAVVPILENDYQTGIATILEMMAMGKCVIATRTRGQTDTIVDGETGVYVPPSDPVALRSAIEKLVAAPEEAARLGGAARRFIEQQASLEHFVERIVRGVEAGHAARIAA
jgi:glycosyltransferase involved in cell wall biosynthesis